jgi:GNAT superfamily N-acetyltransferase
VQTGRPRLGKRTHPLRIRSGTAGDASAILAMIRGLAEFEALAHEVRATAVRIRRHGFGARRYFHVLIASRGRIVVGFALYFFAYSTFLAQPTLYLEDLFVWPGERSNGAGRALLRALARVAVRRGCGRMDWLVLAHNAPAIRFYKGLGARLHEEWVPVRLGAAALRRMARAR